MTIGNRRINILWIANNQRLRRKIIEPLVCLFSGYHLLQLPHRKARHIAPNVCTQYKLKVANLLCLAKYLKYHLPPFSIYPP